MFGFGRKKAVKSIEYDAANEIPIIRCSICNGEKVAGFKNIKTGTFRDAFFVKSEADIEMFAQMCGVDKINREY